MGDFYVSWCYRCFLNTHSQCVSREMSLTPQGTLDGTITTLDLTLSAPDDCICSDPDGLFVRFIFAVIADAPVNDGCRILGIYKLCLDTSISGHFSPVITIHQQSKELSQVPGNVEMVQFHTFFFY